MEVLQQIQRLVEKDLVIFSEKAEISLENGQNDYHDFVNSILNETVHKKTKG